MRRVAVFAFFLLVAALHPSIAAADDDEPTPAADVPEGTTSAPAAADSAGGASAEAATAVLASRRKRSKRGRRHGKAAGRVVPEDQLRREPLPQPSGDLRIVGAGLKDEQPAEVNIFNGDGSYDIEALEEVNYALRCRRTDVEKPIDPRLVTLLSHVYDHFGGKTLEVVSGYRNQRKKTSNHFKGTAADVRIQGVSPKKLRAFAETLDTGGMGIGIYPRSGFVHIDVRPLPSFRWVDYARAGSNASEKRPPRGWKRKKLAS